MSKKAAVKWVKECETMLESMGAIRTDDEYQSYTHTLETIAGPLHFHAHEGEKYGRTRLSGWLAARFDDVERAKQHAWPTQLNPYSGKYNYMTEDLEYIRLDLERLLKEKQ